MIVSITSHLIVEGLKLTTKRTEIEPKKRLGIKRKKNLFLNTFEREGQTGNKLSYPLFFVWA